MYYSEYCILRDTFDGWREGRPNAFVWVLSLYTVHLLVENATRLCRIYYAYNYPISSVRAPARVDATTSARVLLRCMMVETLLVRIAMAV